jgi:hypothetical protein
MAAQSYHGFTVRPNGSADLESQASMRLRAANRAVSI